MLKVLPRGLGPENVGCTGAAAGADGDETGAAGTGRTEGTGAEETGDEDAGAGLAGAGGAAGADGAGAAGVPEARGDRGAGEGFQRYEARQQGEVQEQQFQRGGRLKAGEHLPLAFEHHLPRGMDIRGIELRREVQQALLFRVRHVERGGGRGPGLTDEESKLRHNVVSSRRKKPRSTPRSSNSCVSAATARQS